MAKAQHQGKAISKRAELDAKDKYLEYGYLARQTSEQLIGAIIGDISAMGTSDSNGVLLIEAAGFYLGKLGVGPDKIWQSLKEAEKASGQNMLKGSLNDTLENEETGLAPLFITANGIGLGESSGTVQPSITQPKPATPAPGAPQLPQADRGSPVEALSHKLVDRLYLAAPQSTWTPELDKAFREFIDAGTGTKTMSSGADWNAAAPTLGFKPGLSGALAAVSSLMDKVATKPFGDTVAPAASAAAPAPEAAKPAAPKVAQDTLPAILSVMRQEKMIGTHGADLVNEVKRINVLIEAAGGVNNAAIVLHRQDPSLSAGLPPKLEGPLTPEFVRRNKALFQSIQGAVNKVIAKQFGPLMPHDKEKAISKLREGLKAASVQDQWVKLASQRKDRIRSEVAAEMTVADKITARRIKARESV